MKFAQSSKFKDLLEPFDLEKSIIDIEKSSSRNEIKGYNYIDVDRNQSKLLAAGSNQLIQVFDLMNIDDPPELYKCGASSFYKQVKFSPDGQFIASGSVESELFIYKSLKHKTFKEFAFDFTEEYTRFLDPSTSPYIQDPF